MEGFAHQNNRQYRKRTSYARQRYKYPALAGTQYNPAQHRMFRALGVERKGRSSAGFMLATPVSSVPRAFLLNSIEKGSDSPQRNGQQSTITSIDVRCTIMPYGTTGEAASMVVYLLWYSGKFTDLFSESGGSLTMTDYEYLEPITYVSGNAIYNSYCLPKAEHVGRQYKILRKQRITLPWWGMQGYAVNGQGFVQNACWEKLDWSWYLKTNLTSTWYNDANDGWDLSEGVLVLLVVGDSQPEESMAQLCWQYRIRYVDC